MHTIMTQIAHTTAVCLCFVQSFVLRASALKCVWMRNGVHVAQCTLSSLSEQFSLVYDLIFCLDAAQNVLEFIICIKTREENKQTKRRRIYEVCSRSSTNEFDLMENANTFHSHSLDDDNNEDADILRNSIRPDTSSTHTRCMLRKRKLLSRNFVQGN